MKILFLTLAFLFLFLAFLGAILPVLPTTPFLLLASFFFAKSSNRFERWFKLLPLYKKHLESFEKEHAMTLQTKLTILIPVSIMLMAGILLSSNYIVKGIIALVLITKHVYFILCINTIRLEKQ